MDGVTCAFNHEPVLIDLCRDVGVRSKLAAGMMCTYCKTACENMSVRVCLLWTPIAPHEILKSEDGDAGALRLAGDVSWSSAGLWAVVMVVWPTHSLRPCSPPSPPPSPLFSHWADDLHAWDDFSSPIAGGEGALDVQHGPNSFKSLPRTNSDFRGFHSWVDTDVLVSAIMGPLSFHANWLERAELRGGQHREKENL